MKVSWRMEGFEANRTEIWGVLVKLREKLGMNEASRVATWLIWQPLGFVLI
jgi:hypothetical protein